MNVPKSPKEKTEFAITLLSQGKTYREVQQMLVEQFGSGMSNTTLLKLQYPKPKIEDLLKRIDDLEQELLLFKRLYFELVAVTKDKLELNKPQPPKTIIRYCASCGAPVQPVDKKCGNCGAEMGQ
ncbi:MAG: hypothetical protein RBG13Loki_0053 [Promethearchaeota archaeon CR_4]|nr:MAG: hypothetical protein RBG13Loki_0053 [Candidatus Lokiarchaeota archaeon CR_4]